MRQYLYFCTSKAGKLSTWRSEFVRLANKRFGGDVLVACLPDFELRHVLHDTEAAVHSAPFRARDLNLLLQLVIDILEAQLGYCSP